MNAKTNIGFVEFAKEALAADTGYVYGTIGQICTIALLNNCAARYPANNLAGGTMRKVGEKWLGHSVNDCIGLLKHYMFTNKFGDVPVYDRKYDLSANGAYEQATVKGPINTLPEVPGICLHLPGHFGVYIGNGEVIEAKGTAYGVVKTKVAGRGWTAWFKSPWLTYVPAVAATCSLKGNFNIARGQYITAKVTSVSTPNFCAGNDRIVKHELIEHSGNVYTYKLTALGSEGEAAGIYLDDKRIAIATIVSNRVMSDTTNDFSIKHGEQYQFKFTAQACPVCVAGSSGVVDISFVRQEGNKFYFVVKTTGAPGMKTGIYLNGNKLLTITVS